MSISPELKSKLLWAATALFAGAGGPTAGSWGLDQLRNQSSVSVTFTGQARSALDVRDENGQPIVTTQDYSRACMAAVDTEARQRLKAYAEKPPATN